MTLLAAPTSWAEGPDGEDNPAETSPVLATYNGELIDLGEGWGSAEICTEVAEGDVRCYDNAEEEVEDLADESLGHAVQAEQRGMEVEGLSTRTVMKRGSSSRCRAA
ncbi:hypothetical protein ACH4TS_32790 [Streptomyces albidoflavus]